MKRFILLVLAILTGSFFLRANAQDPVVLTGQITHFFPVGKLHVLTAYVHEPAFNDEVNYITEIKADGTFTIRVPVDRPSGIRLEYGKNLDVYCQPGTTMFLSWDATNPEETLTFEGADASLNRMLKKFWGELKQVRGKNGGYQSNYDLVKNSPEEYKAFEYANMERDLNFYEAFLRQNPVNDLFKKKVKYDIEYNCTVNLLRYRWTKPAKVVLPADYFDFLGRFNPDNGDALVSPMYTDMFLNEYIMYFSDLIQKQAKTIKKKEPGVNEYAQALMEGAGVSEDDRIYLRRLADAPGTRLDAADTAFLISFAKRHESLIMEKFPPSMPVLDYCLSQPEGVVRNVLFSNQLYNFIDANYLDEIRPYIARYDQAVGDERLKNKILSLFNERSLKLSVYTPNANARLNTPLNHAGDSLLEKLTAKYKGKVVYIDFWATWCGPCKDEIPGSQQLKKELAGKPVVFLYLGVQSPENTWKAVISELKMDGEHYLLNNTEYQLLANKFQISGIPHYVLADKDGKIVHANALRPSHPELRNQITTLISR